MPFKNFITKLVDDKCHTYSKELSFELYSSEGLSNLESPAPKLSTHTMRTHNVSSRNF